MRSLVGQLNENGVVEEYDGPWKALVVLDAKPCSSKICHGTIISGGCVCPIEN